MPELDTAGKKWSLPEPIEVEAFEGIKRLLSLRTVHSIFHPRHPGWAWCWEVVDGRPTVLLFSDAGLAFDYVKASGGELWHADGNWYPVKWTVVKALRELAQHIATWPQFWIDKGGADAAIFPVLDKRIERCPAFKYRIEVDERRRARSDRRKAKAANRGAG